MPPAAAAPPAEEEEGAATGAAMPPPAERAEAATAAAAAPPAPGDPPSPSDDSKPGLDDLGGKAAATGGDGGLVQQPSGTLPPTGPLPVVLRVDVATQLQAQILSWSVIILNLFIVGVALGVILWRSNRKGKTSKTTVGEVCVGRGGGYGRGVLDAVRRGRASWRITPDHPRDELIAVLS